MFLPLNRPTSIRTPRVLLAVALLSPGALFACSGGDEQPSSETDGASIPESSNAVGSDLTADELENGLGPIRSVDVEEGVIDVPLADRGAEIFTLKCSACHKMDTRYVGPALGDVATRRSPAFVMNMILNPAEMIESHPEARQLLAEYYTPMAFQDVTEEDARALLEYLRREAQEESSAP